MIQLWALVLAFTLLPAQGCTMADNNPETSPRSTRILVFSQSIGRGVPQEAQQGFADIRKLLISNGLSPAVSSWGLEGEQRLCVILSVEQRNRLMPEITKMSEGVKLLKIEELEEDSGECEQ